MLNSLEYKMNTASTGEKWWLSMECAGKNHVCASEDI